MKKGTSVAKKRNNAKTSSKIEACRACGETSSDCKCCK